MGDSEAKMLAAEIRAAADEFNRLAELAAKKGVRVEVSVLPLRSPEWSHDAPVLQVSIAREV